MCAEQSRSYQLKFAKDSLFIGITIFSEVIGKTFLLLPILTKNLSAYYYGLWSQANVTVGFAMTFVCLGLPYTMSRFLAARKNKEEIREEFYSVFFLVFLVAAISAFLIIMLSDVISQILFDGESHIVKITGLIILIWALDWVFLNLFRAFREMKKYAFFMIGKIVCEIGVIAYLVFNGYGLLAMLFAVFGVKAALFVALFCVVNQRVAFKIPRFFKIKEYLKFGLPTVPANISSWAVSSSDRYIIGYYLGATSVGIYAVGYGFGGLLIMVVSILGFVLPATLSHLYDNGKLNDVKTILQYSLKYFLLFAIPFLFGTIAIAHNIITILATKEIADKGHFIVPFVALSSVFFGFYAITSQILILVKKTKIIGGLWIFAALINFVLNILIIPYWGILGAAITTIIAYCVAMIITVYFSFREFRYKIDWSFITKSIGASIIMALVIRRINPANFLSVVATIIIGTVLYCIILIILQGFKRSEYLFFKKLIVSSLS